MSNLSTTIKALRKNKGLTQTELADIVGVKFQSLQKWESGETNPTAKRLPVLADALGVTLDELMSGSLTELTEGVNLTGNVKSILPNISTSYTYLPFLSAKAQAVLTTMPQHINELQLEETYPVFIPSATLNNKQLVVEMVGDTMQPEIKSGARCLAEKINEVDFANESGAVYAVWYSNRFVIKRIKTNDIRQSGTLTLWSDNERYGHITVLSSEIKSMWKVLRKVDELIQ